MNVQTLCTIYYILHTTYYILHTTYYMLHTAYYILDTTYYILPTTYYILPTAYYLLPATYYPLPTTYHLLPASYYLLPTTCYLLLLRLLLLGHDRIPSWAHFRMISVTPPLGKNCKSMVFLIGCSTESCTTAPGRSTMALGAGPRGASPSACPGHPSRACRGRTA